VTDRAEAGAEVDWRARAEEAERRAAEAWTAYHRLAAERGDAEYYRHLLKDREHSMSWRITSPLRFGMLVLRWLRKKVKEVLSRR
jgi:hypothetical protein